MSICGVLVAAKRCGRAPRVNVQACGAVERVCARRACRLMRPRAHGIAAQRAGVRRIVGDAACVFGCWRALVVWGGYAVCWPGTGACGVVCGADDGVPAGVAFWRCSGSRTRTGGECD